jgi:hypothetical protein
MVTPEMICVQYCYINTEMASLCLGPPVFCLFEARVSRIGTRSLLNEILGLKPTSGKIHQAQNAITTPLSLSAFAVFFCTPCSMRYMVGQYINPKETGRIGGRYAPHVYNSTTLDLCREKFTYRYWIFSQDISEMAGV